MGGKQVDRQVWLRERLACWYQSGSGRCLKPAASLRRLSLQGGSPVHGTHYIYQTEEFYCKMPFIFWMISQLNTSLTFNLLLTFLKLAPTAIMGTWIPWGVLTGWFAFVFNETSTSCAPMELLQHCFWELNLTSHGNQNIHRGNEGPFWNKMLFSYLPSSFFSPFFVKAAVFLMSTEQPCVSFRASPWLCFQALWCWIDG